CLRQHLAKDFRYGRSEKKNVAVTAGHAPLGGCNQEADLRRGQGFRRAAPSPSPRPQDRHVQRPPGSEEKGILIGFKRRPGAGHGRGEVRKYLAPEFVPTGVGFLLDEKAWPMSMIGFPLLLIPLAICNIIVFLMPGVAFATPLFTLILMSGVAWP